MRALAVWALLITLFAWSTPVGAQELDRREIRQLGDQVIEMIQNHYVFEDRKLAITEPIAARLQAGVYDTIVRPDSLAAVLTRDLHESSRDKHLYVEYVSGGGDETTAVDWDAWAEQERRNEVLNNFGFTDLRILPGNVGYLRIVEFMHPDRGFDAASSAMLFLGQTEAMIVDLRGNGGGYGGLMDLILSSYFGPEPTHISTTVTSNHSETPTKTFTLPFVPGRRRVGQPLYVLINRKTGSAAEFFAYTLQAFDKAVVVGEPSAGAAHMNTYYDLSGGFRISISTGAPVNARTGANWEGEGVQPDVRVPAAEVLCAAHRLAVRALLERSTNEQSRTHLQDVIRQAICANAK